MHIQSPRPLHCHRSYRVSGPVAGAPNFFLRARVRPVRPLSPSPGCRQRLQRHFGLVRPYLYEAILEASEKVRQQLVSQLQSSQLPVAAATEGPAWTAVSSQFPGLKARVVALGVADVTLAVEGELAVGSALEFRLQDIELKGVLLWCRAEPIGGFRIGIQFEEMQHQQRQAIRDLLASG